MSSSSYSLVLFGFWVLQGKLRDLGKSWLVNNGALSAVLLCQGTVSVPLDACVWHGKSRGFIFFWENSWRIFILDASIVFQGCCMSYCRLFGLSCQVVLNQDLMRQFYCLFVFQMRMCLRMVKKNALIGIYETSGVCKDSIIQYHENCGGIKTDLFLLYPHFDHLAARFTPNRRGNMGRCRGSCFCFFITGTGISKCSWWVLVFEWVSVAIMIWFLYSRNFLNLNAKCSQHTISLPSYPIYSTCC